MISREKPMSKNAILQTYFGALLFATATGLFVWFNGEDGVSIFQKSLLAPLYLLATTGLRHFFPRERDHRRGILTMLEYHALEAAVLGIFLLIVIDPLPNDLRGQILYFCLFVIVVGGANFALGTLQKSRHGENR